MRRIRTVRWITIAVVVLGLTIWTVWGNTAVQCNTITVTADDAFSRLRIAQVPDLHNASFGEGNEKLLEILADTQPDLIAITGDLVDSRRTNSDIALSFAEKAVQFAPCYFVTGNHEARIDAFSELEADLIAAGVTVLRDQSTEFEYNGERIQIIGLDDPAFDGTDSWDKTDAEAVGDKIRTLAGENTDFKLLLSHRPELFDTYCTAGVDLVLSGHAHGGQFRLPLIGGLVAPNQGLFPKYDAGLYQSGGTAMVVSRGLGNSILPVRFNNRPEVVVIEFTAK